MNYKVYVQKAGNNDKTNCNKLLLVTCYDAADAKSQMEGPYVTTMQEWSYQIVKGYCGPPAFGGIAPTTIIVERVF